MKNVVTVADMRIADSEEIKRTSAKELMQRAGNAIYCSYRYNELTAIICGKGNNGGDGFVLASFIKDNGGDCEIILLERQFSCEGRYFYEQCIDRKIKITEYSPDIDLRHYKIIVDCIFGTGFRGKVDERTAALIEKINNSGAYVISVDINSGLNGDNGMVENVCVKSDLTISIGTYKTGLFLNMAKDYIKNLVNVDIGIPIKTKYGLVEPIDFKEYLSERKNFSHKGTYGYIGIMGGNRNYVGAVKLATLGLTALRSGCGVARIIIPDVLYQTIANSVVEATIFSISTDLNGYMNFDRSEIDEALHGLKAIAIGMGWGRNETNFEILKYVLENYAIPVIIDADGLVVLSNCLEVLKHTNCKIVLTPHLKELSVLCGKSMAEILNDPIRSVIDFAKEYNVTILLKGPTTIITDGENTYLSDKGCAGMATAGSGDVLSGILAGIMGQGFNNIALSVAYATYLNGLSGELAQADFTDIAMTSYDTIRKIPSAIQYCREQCGIYLHKII